MPEGELLALEPETRMEGIVFRALSAPGSGFPDEAAAIAASRLEEDIVEVHAIESVGEVLGAGKPEPSASGGLRPCRNFERTSGASRNCSSGWRMRSWKSARILMTPRGNTIKRLTRDMSGYWRYRLGDFRLVYRPDNDRPTVYCYRLAPRGGAYD